jgi:hypothetical protein
MKAPEKKAGTASSHAQRLSMSLKVRVIEAYEREGFNGLLREKHYLGKVVGGWGFFASGCRARWEMGGADSMGRS